MDSQKKHAAAHRIGIDLGGTKTEAVVLAPSGGIVWRRRNPTPAGNSYAAILRNVVDVVGDAERQVAGAEAPTVGIGIPGSIRRETRRIQNANTTCLIGRPFQQDLEDRLGRRIVMENDANCFTLAEAAAGAAKGYEMVVGVIMGTGCGGGLFINGAIRQGPHGIAGEWGHVVVDPDGTRCYCGNRGCVETLISGGGVARRFAKETGRTLRMEEIVSGARSGDEDCRRAFDRFLDDFGRCLGGLISILDPDAVVLGRACRTSRYVVEKVRRYAFGNDIRAVYALTCRCHRRGLVAEKGDRVPALTNR
jgi:fructokinase